MTLELSDYEKINTEIQRGIDRIERQIATLVTRAEHIGLVERVAQIEAKMNSGGVWLLGEQEKTRLSIEQKFDKMTAMIDAVEVKVDAITTAQSSARDRTIRYIISVIVSFVLGGGGLFGLLEALHVFH